MLDLLKAADFWISAAATFLFAVGLFSLKRCLKAVACKGGKKKP